MKKKAKYKYIWVCECFMGACDYESEKDLRHNNHTKFCGRQPKVRKERTV